MRLPLYILVYAAHYNMLTAGKTSTHFKNIAYERQNPFSECKQGDYTPSVMIAALSDDISLLNKPLWWSLSVDMESER